MQANPLVYITWTPPKYWKLQEMYAQAVISGEDRFMMEGQIILTAYAKYLIEFLKEKME